MGFFDAVKKAFGGGAEPAKSPEAGPAATPTGDAGADAGTGDLVMDPKKYFFADNDVRAKVAMQCAQGIAPVIGGSIKADGSDLQVSGQYRGRPARLAIRVTFGTATIEVVTARQFLDAPTIDLKYDKDTAPPGDPAARDAWDERDRKEQKLFFSPHVRLEGTPKELKETKGLLDRLPPGLQSTIVAAIEQQGEGRLMFVLDSVKWFAPAALLLHKQAPAKFTERLETICAFAEALEQAWPDKATWTPMPARLLSAQPTGTLINMNLQVAAVLEIQGSQGPYQAETLALVPQMSLAAFQPGASIQVRVNPANPREVAVFF
jgi:hypothetical protein